MRRHVLCGALVWGWLGCDEGYAHGSAPLGFPGVGSPEQVGASHCEPTLDTPTPLGITGAQLLALYGGEFDVELVPRSGAGGEIAVLERVHVVVAYRPEEGDDMEDATSCAVLALPVTVSMRGPSLELSEAGTLVGTPLVGQIDFASERVSSGRIVAQQGQRSVQLVVQDALWSTEDGR
jgi:hypothetical protein